MSSGVVTGIGRENAKTIYWLIRLHPVAWLISATLTALSIVSELLTAAILYSILGLLQRGSHTSVADSIARIPGSEYITGLLGALDPRTQLLIIGSAILGLAVVRAGLSYAKQVFSAYQQMVCIEDLSQRYYLQLMNLPLIATLDRSKAALLNNATRFTLEAAWMVVLSAQLAGNAVQIPLYLLAMYAISSWLGVAACFLLGVTVLALNRWLMPIVQSRTRTANDEVNVLTKWVLESVDGKILFLSLDGLTVATKEFKRRLERYTKALFGREKVRFAVEPLIVLFSLSVLSGFVVFLALTAVSPEQALAQVALFVFLLTRLPIIATLINDAVAQIRTYMDSAQRVVGMILDANPDPTKGSAFSGIRSQVELRHVSFSYQDGTRRIRVLEDVCLTIPKASVIALVGASGAGKSTLAKLILRFLPSDRGSILVDGNRVEMYSEASWRRRIVYVPQDAFLLDDTVANNIRFGRISLGKEAVIEAAKLASAHEFIMSLPQGYDTPVGENGCRLSGGQRQRLTLARSLAGNPDMLILDETTGNLDSETENAIRGSIRMIGKHCAVLIIAHRLSTITDADQIHFLDEGRIVESGTHASLLNRGGKYASYCEFQAL